MFVVVFFFDGCGHHLNLPELTLSVPSLRSSDLAQLRGRAVLGAELVAGAGADAIVYLAVNGPAFPVAMFAAAYAGVPLVPLNYRLGVEQLEQLLANHPSALVIAHPGAHPNIPAGRTVLTPEQWMPDTPTAEAAQPEPCLDRKRTRPNSSH